MALIFRAFPRRFLVAVAGTQAESGSQVAWKVMPRWIWRLPRGRSCGESFGKGMTAMSHYFVMDWVSSGSTLPWG